VGHLVQPPCRSRVTQSRLHRTLSSQGWNISREGDSTAPLGSLGQGSIKTTNPSRASNTISRNFTSKTFHLLFHSSAFPPSHPPVHVSARAPDPEALRAAKHLPLSPCSARQSRYALNTRGTGAPAQHPTWPRSHRALERQGAELLSQDLTSTPTLSSHPSQHILRINTTQAPPQTPSFHWQIIYHDQRSSLVH